MNARPDTAAMGPRRHRLQDAALYLVATWPAAGDRDAGSARLAAVAAAVDGGADLVQLRLKDGSTADRRAWLVRAREVLGPEVLLIVNDDLEAVRDAAGAPLADGLHLGRRDAAALCASAPSVAGPRDVAAGLARARAILGPDLLLGTSTATLDEVAAARAAGADHAGFGALAPTATKADTRPADPRELRRCLQAHPGFPLFPIGGLGPHNLHLVVAAGARRAAIGAAILDAPDPRAAARACRRALEAAAPAHEGPRPQGP